MILEGVALVVELDPVEAGEEQLVEELPRVELAWMGQHGEATVRVDGSQRVEGVAVGDIARAYPARAEELAVLHP